MRNSVWIQSVRQNTDSVMSAIDAGLTAVGRYPHRNERWVVKLNLTYPRYLPGVVNSPVFVEGLCRWSSECGIKIIFVEGDGGNGAYSAEDTFYYNGVSKIAKRYGAECLSISKKPWEWRITNLQDKMIRFPYSPFLMSREYDMFITTPLFKNHIFTTVTLGMKNLWGCIPDAYRMYYHYQLDHGIVALYMELMPDFSIFDGLTALRGRGPMDGQSFDMNAVMVAGSVGAGEIAALEIMGISLEKVKHLEIADGEGLLPEAGQLIWMSDPEKFRRNDFVVDRSIMNRLSMIISKFPVFMKIVYHSPLSPAIYWVVNRIRGDTAQVLLYKDKMEGRYEKKQ